MTCPRSQPESCRARICTQISLILYLVSTFTHGYLGAKCSATGEGLWDVLVEGPRCQARRLAFILKASGGFEA